MMRNLPKGDNCEVLSLNGLTVGERFTRIGNIEYLDNLRGVSGSTATVR